ncbi:MAG: hypothetical protein HY660_18755 [Armatimonadetes bacterium]|nr:hypothetical protein [Armatimonadota bacterium]
MTGPRWMLTMSGDRIVDLAKAHEIAALEDYGVWRVRAFFPIGVGRTDERRPYWVNLAEYKGDEAKEQADRFLTGLFAWLTTGAGEPPEF